MANMTKYPEHDKEIERAIKFLVFAIQESGKNPKPVVLHSMRIGLHLYGLGYGKDIVIAAILHDALEDTDTTAGEIKSKFGDKVTKLVEANSFDESIESKTERYRENFERCCKAGKGALIIKAADIMDNSDYYHLAPSKELAKYLLGKMKYFIEKSGDVLKGEIIYRELKNKYEEIAKTL
jgi:(p)ppGpp synthase/HD superfamily hydrolase